jgi:plastocyanin
MGRGRFLEMTASTIDYWPADITIRVIIGDPVSFTLRLRDTDGNIIDTSLWEWRATVDTGTYRLDFEIQADVDNVRFFMRGDDTARLTVGKPGSFDIACRPDAAGEGNMVGAGMVFARGRVTDPLRHNPDLLPGREEDLVPG